MRTPLIAALVLLTGLAGCTDEVDPLLTPQRELAYSFEGYTWIPTIGLATDSSTSNVTLLDSHSLLGGDQTPHFVQQMVPHAGAEPNIGITSQGNIFISTFDTVQRSSDYGQTWKVVHDFKLPSAPTMADGWSSSDPMLWVDKDTDRVYSLSMHPTPALCYALSWSDDEGETWSDRIGGEGRPGLNCNLPYTDHPKVVTGPPRSSSLLQPLPQPIGYPNMLYICTNKVETMFTGTVLGSWCSTSYDGGKTWAHETRAIESRAYLAGDPPRCGVRVLRDQRPPGGPS